MYPTFYAGALDALTDHVCVVDAAGVIVAVNAAWRRFGEENGAPARYLVPGPSYFDACDPVHGDDAELAAQAARGIREVLDGTRARFDLDYPCHSPTMKRWFTLRVTGFTSRDAPYAVIAHEEVTNRVESQRALHEVQRQLHHAQKMEAVGQLAAGVAHDFNNLLMGVRGSCQLGRRRTDDPAARAVFSDIENASTRGSAIVDQLLAFSRRAPEAPRATELDAAVQRTVALFGHLAGEDLALTLRCDAPGRWVPIEPGQLEQVVLNLLLNAREAMPSGGRLELRTAVEGDRVRVEVEDSGVGMDAATRARIFEPFFTTKPRGQGTGLGLSTLYGIVTSVGGRVEVRSEPAVGTCFTLYLPQGVPDAPDARSPSTPPAARRLTALVVEDEALVRMTVRMYLEDAGYRVVEADGAVAARACAAGTRIDVVVTDMVLPGGTGPEVVAAIRERLPDVAALYMSAYPNELLVAQGRLPEGTPSLKKPFEAEDLFAAIRAALPEE